MGSILEWEENVFLGIKALYRRLVERPRDRQRAALRARLDPLRQELFLLARMIAGRPVPIVETPHAALCDESHLFLPNEFTAASSVAANEALYRLKTLLGALALRPGGLPEKNQPISAQIDAWTREFPALPEWIAAVQPLPDLWSLLGEPVPGGREDPAASEQRDPLAPPDDDTPPDDLTEIEGRGQIGVKALDDPGDQPAESEMPIHTFEKAETLEEYTGLDRKTDDEDELEDHEEALRALDMTQVLRSRERPRSIYRADIVMDSLALDSADPIGPHGGIPYPEWDHKQRRHKDQWCRVHSRPATEAPDPHWAAETARKHRATILDLRKKIAALATQARRAKHQPHGPELDIDAVIRARIDSRAGQPPDERLYIQRRRRLHDVAALILMDRSYSTDAWIDDARVLDTIRETLFCAGEVLDEFVESFAVAGFSSHTRRQCDFDVVKDFHEPWRVARARLGGLEARGYTRIGPALRHAQELLDRQPAERKIILLLTDGRPCDYDRYEGEYGIRDVRKAIETGALHGIRTHAFAIEKRAREQFPRMFRRQDYDVVPDPRALVAALCGVFARLRLAE